MILGYRYFFELGKCRAFPQYVTEVGYLSFEETLFAVHFIDRQAARFAQR